MHSVTPWLTNYCPDPLRVILVASWWLQLIPFDSHLKWALIIFRCLRPRLKILSVFFLFYCLLPLSYITSLLSFICFPSFPQDSLFCDMSSLCNKSDNMLEFFCYMQNIFLVQRGWSFTEFSVSAYSQLSFTQSHFYVTSFCCFICISY